VAHYLHARHKQRDPVSTSPGTPHEDDVWNAIVADLSTDPSLSRHVFPAPDPAEPPEPDPLLDELPDFDEIPDEIPNDGPEEFVAPDPGPIELASDALTRFAWAGALGGPVLLMLANVFDWGRLISGVGVGAAVAGFVVLIARHRDDRDDDFTDGAVI